MFLVIGFLKDAVLGGLLTAVSAKSLGARVKIQKFSLSLPFQKVRLQEVYVYNPPGFPAEPLLHLPEVVVQWDLLKMTQGKYVFPLVTVNLEELTVVKNAQGRLNVDSLKAVEDVLKKGKRKEAGTPSGAPVEPPFPPFYIKELELNVGRVIFKDLSQAGPPVIQVFDVALKNKKFKAIDHPAQLASLIIIEALKPTAIRKAGIFAATSLLGVGFLPAAAFGIVVADDDASVLLEAPFNRVFDESLALARELGQVIRTDKEKGQIFAKIHKCDIVFTIRKETWRKTHVQIKARKYLLAKAEIANGLLYQLVERLP